MKPSQVELYADLSFWLTVMLVSGALFVCCSLWLLRSWSAKKNPPAKYITILITQKDGKTVSWADMLTNDFNLTTPDGTKIRVLVEATKPPGYGDF